MDKAFEEKVSGDGVVPPVINVGAQVSDYDSLVYKTTGDMWVACYRKFAARLVLHEESEADEWPATLVAAAREWWETHLDGPTVKIVAQMYGWSSESSGSKGPIIAKLLDARRRLMPVEAAQAWVRQAHAVAPSQASDASRAAAKSAKEAADAADHHGPR